jgi:2-oxoglutarate dehydrogenase E2 component (dihydrolipoamide succinyltransferase)
MAQVPIVVPGVGESISEGILSRWLKPDGAAVKAGEPLFELETDKASNVVPAPGDGTLKIGVPEGETVAIGATVGQLDPDAAPTAAKPEKSGNGREPAKSEPRAQPAPAAKGAQPARESRQAGDGGPALSPAARRVVAEQKLDPGQISPTGRGGLITKEDALRHVASAQAPPKSEPPRPPSMPAVSPRAAAPADRRQTRQRMTGIRRRIAERLVEAQRTAAILTTFNEADLSRVIELRARYKEPFQKKYGVGLGFMGFFVKAAVEALQAFPAVNGRIEGEEIVHNHFYDIGVAVSTERGLMVPVVRDADRLSFAEIEKAIADFARKARENAIAVEDLQGGTFTITNGGVFGSLLSTPILNPPQSAILGMHAIQKRPIAVDDQVVIRPMMYLALSYDHRIIDGREAVSFLVRIKECIEDPQRLLLEI